MKIIIAGGTGFLGQALSKQLLGNGDRVVVLSRQSKGELQHRSLTYEQWDGETAGGWTSLLDGADAVINLAGASIADKRWSGKRKQLLHDSRIRATRTIVQAIANSRQRPRVLLNASAVGFYGNVDEGEVVESSPKGSGFLADLCGAWENEAQRAKEYGVRVVLLRIGVVLERDGGALKKMLLPFRLFVGGSLGSGRQWFPWIHIGDVLTIVNFCLRNDRLSGPVNVAAPKPVRMKEFCETLGRAIRRPSWAPVPGVALNLLLGEMSGMLLGGQQTIPAKLLEAGFTFQHPALGDALSDIFSPQVGPQS